MRKIALIALIDFDTLTTTVLSSMGGIASVIKNIIPFIKTEDLFLIGFKSERKEGSSVNISEDIKILHLFNRGESSYVPVRFLGILNGYKIIKLLRNKKISAVYSHSEELSFWLSFITNIKYIHHLHGAGNALLYAKKNLYRIPFLIWLWEKLRQRSIQRSYKVIAIDNDSYKLCKKYNKPDKDIIRLPNFVDTNIFYPDKNYKEIKEKYNLSSKKIILFVGRLSEVKGLELFIDTIERLNHSKRNNWQGVIIGDGDYGHTIKEYVKRNDLCNSIRFMGAISDPVILRKFYTLADVFVLTSYHEGVPITALESLACGTPVVSTAVGGLPSLIKPGINGFTISSRSSIDFAKYIIQTFDSSMKNDTIINTIPYTAENAAKILIGAFDNIEKD